MNARALQCVTLVWGRLEQRYQMLLELLETVTTTTNPVDTDTIQQLVAAEEDHKSGLKQCLKQTSEVRSSIDAHSDDLHV